MYRICFVLAALGIGGTVAARSSTHAWPLRATITSPRGGTIPFRAVTLGAELIVYGDSRTSAKKARANRSDIQPLARGDTLMATTPASFPLDLRGGAIVFLATGKDSVRVVIGRNPFGANSRVSAQGRRLTARLRHDSVVLEAR
jgi:hypothetical protein